MCAPRFWHIRFEGLLCMLWYNNETVHVSFVADKSASHFFYLQRSVQTRCCNFFPQKLPEFLLPCSFCEAMPIRRTTSSFRSAIWGPVAGLMQLGASNRPFRGAPSRPSQWCLFIGSPWHFGGVAAKPSMAVMRVGPLSAFVLPCLSTTSKSTTGWDF